MPNVASTEQTTKRTGRSPKIQVPFSERAFYSPNEAAAICGKQTTWAYRLIYEGKLKVNRNIGRMMIPRGEIERLQAEATVMQ